MSCNVIKYDGVEKFCQGSAVFGTEVMELLLPLLSDQFLALEAEAHWLNLTVGQLIRHTVGEFLMQCAPSENFDNRRCN
jgi:hypothetical protein